jgi:predicted  nucleic acid-binding Zn-ribbon protein
MSPDWEMQAVAVISQLTLVLLNQVRVESKKEAELHIDEIRDEFLFIIAFNGYGTYVISWRV